MGQAIQGDRGELGELPLSNKRQNPLSETYNTILSRQLVSVSVQDSCKERGFRLCLKDREGGKTALASLVIPQANQPSDITPY